MNEKSKLLVVVLSYPFPPSTGGSIIAYNNVKQLSKKYSIDVVCLDDVKDLGDFASFVDGIDFISRIKSPNSIQRLFYMLMGIPSWVTDYKSKKMQKRIDEKTKKVNYDAILLYGLNTVQYVSPENYKKVFLNMEDPQSIRYMRLAKLPVFSLYQKIRLFVDSILMARYEKRFLPKVARVFLLSKADILDMKQKFNYNNLCYISYGVNCFSVQHNVGYGRRTKGVIVFSGNMYHPPNVDGAIYFLQKILPFILNDYPTAVLWIVGASPDIRIVESSNDYGKNVVLTGKVKNVLKYLKSAMVSVCPIRLRIGVQTKILEALSVGTPVVTTSAGNSGIVGCSGKELWVEDEPKEFANRVVELLQGENWNTLSENGRKLVEKRFSWEQSAVDIENYVKAKNKSFS
jgi:glycosyltransferase involved in cell wall biosynthesis